MYSEREKIDASRINEISEVIFNDTKNWDTIFNDLITIYNNIPSNGYKNSFEEDGKFYVKFWDKDEFLYYCRYLEDINDKQDIVWIFNAYPLCCYFLSIICIERGDFNSAFEFLKKGIELEPDNPMLLSEMGLLLTAIATQNRTDEIFNQSISYYEQAFSSRPFNTNSQKARALRGIGYVLIEIGKFEQAQKMYEISLTWEESQLAKKELEIISQHLNESGGKIVQGSSNVSKVNGTTSFDYFTELLEKLPYELKEKLPNKFVYIWTKASRLLSIGFKNYQENDYFKYPLFEWDEEEMTSIIIQIAHYLKGFDINHLIEIRTLDSAINTLLTFHFEKIEIKLINQIENIHAIKFKHKMDGSEIVLFFRLQK